MKSIFGIEEMVAGTVLILFGHEIFPRLRFEKFNALQPQSFHAVRRVQPEILFMQFKFLFGILRIENHVLFIALIDAADAVLARNAIFQKVTVAAILAVLAVAQSVTLQAIHALVAEFAFIANGTIDNGYALFEQI